MPKFHNFVVVDLLSLNKHFPSISRMWVKSLKWMSEVRSAGFFLQPHKTLIQLRGKAAGLTKAKELLRGLLPSFVRGQIHTVKRLDRGGDSREIKLLRSVATTLKTVHVTHDEDVLRIRANAPYNRVVSALALVALSLTKSVPFGRAQEP